MRQVTRKYCVSGHAGRCDRTGDTQSAFPNITHVGHGLAMFYPKHRRSVDAYRVTESMTTLIRR